MTILSVKNLRVKLMKVEAKTKLESLTWKKMVKMSLKKRNLMILMVCNRSQVSTQTESQQVK